MSSIPCGSRSASPATGAAAIPSERRSTVSVTLVDFDLVELTNVTTQGYLAADIGLSKVEATARAVRQIDSTIKLSLIEDRFRPHLSVGDVVFCCVDSISARAAIWRAVN